LLEETSFKQEAWDLTDLLPSSVGPEFDAILAELEAGTVALESLRERLPRFSWSDVEEHMRIAEKLVETLSRLNAYSSMLYSSDTQNQESKELLDRVEDLNAETKNRTLFLKLYWVGLDNAAAAVLLPSNPDHAYYLTSLRKLKPHMLDEKAEQVVNIKNTTGFSGWLHHYDLMVSDFTFDVRTRQPSGEEAIVPRKLNFSETTSLFASPVAAEREAAYRAVMEKYGENGLILGEVYRTIVRDWRNEYVQLRRYASPISPRNLENDVSDGSVDALLTTCRSNSTVFQEFFRLKAKMLGFEKMTRYHIHAPLTQEERKIEYPDAVRMVLDAYNEFDPRFADLARNVFTRRHVDSELRKAKKTGAYCMSISPRTVPYIMLNYAGSIRDVYTVAHECGHAIHGQLTWGHSMLTYFPTLVMAETASVFGEMILFDRFMKSEKDAEVKKAVLLEKIGSMYSTIGRQAYFVVYEEEAHAAVADGATVSKLCSSYLANLREQFGESVEVPDEFKWEWTVIPHIFHTPFYCYAYAFGNLLSLALYDRYTREGREFVPTYVKILSSGSSRGPQEILGEIGIDIESKEFFQGGFDVIDRMVGELRRL
jgi:oligoendopeptidase F